MNFTSQATNKKDVGLIGKLMVLGLILLVNLNLYAQIGILTDTPHASSALEIESSNKGILIPRIILTSNINSSSPVSSPATGLLIFNSGTNQPMGFYYWNSSKWVSTSFSTTGWSTTGNTSTSINTNYLGTSDDQHLAIRTNNTEKIRIESDGQIIIGATSPITDEDLFTVVANSTQYFAINAYSPNGYGVYSNAATISLYGTVDNPAGYSLWAKNIDNNGNGAMLIGANASAFNLADHYTALCANGTDGIFSLGQASDGIGIIAGGSGATTLSTINEGAGGAFTGYHGVYGKGINSNSGVGIVGVGNNGSTYTVNTNGSGGAFTGYHGVFATSTNSNDGTGVIGVGNAGSYYVYANGSGGAFTGRSAGIAAWATLANANSIGIYGCYNGSGSYDGTGIYGIAYTSNSNRGYGVYGQGERYGVYANGDLGASGSKSFAIDHPLDPENKILKHYSIESPEVLNMYRGNTFLDTNGNSEIILPNYFTEININYSYVLTPIGKQAPNLHIKDEIDNNGKFTVSGGSPGQKISWVVYSERNDPYMQQNRSNQTDIVEKEDDNKGKYIMPELYGQPKSKGIFYRENTKKSENTITKQENKTPININSDNIKTDLSKQ